MRYIEFFNMADALFFPDAYTIDTIPYVSIVSMLIPTCCHDAFGHWTFVHKEQINVRGIVARCVSARAHPPSNHLRSGLSESG